MKVHGHALRPESPTYSSWRAMRHRCLLPTAKRYHRYGGRGITVCERWSSFEAFLADMGERPAGTQLDRINNDGNYEPGNCRWSTPKEQSRNTGRNRLVSAFGRTLSLAGWVEETGIARDVLRARLRSGWDAERALTEPSTPIVSQASRRPGATRGVCSWCGLPAGRPGTQDTLFECGRCRARAKSRGRDAEGRPLQPPSKTPSTPATNVLPAPAGKE